MTADRGNDGDLDTSVQIDGVGEWWKVNLEEQYNITSVAFSSAQNDRLGECCLKLEQRSRFVLVSVILISWRRNIF